jgi:hypothetical protein
MKGKLDENVSVLVAASLGALGHDVDSVVDERLAVTWSRHRALFECGEPGGGTRNVLDWKHAARGSTLRKRTPQA